MSNGKVSQNAGYEQVCRKLDEPGTLVVGIDAAKGRHVGCVALAGGSVVLRRLRIEGTAAGFARLEEGLKRLGPLEKMVVGMEPTGGYTACLDAFLRERGATVVYVHPLKVKSNRRTLDLSANKSDDRDTENIADLMHQRKFYIPLSRDGANRLFLAVVQQYDTVARARSRQITRLRMLLEGNFPELERAGAQGMSATLLAVLKRMPHPAMIRCLSLEAFRSGFAGEKRLGRKRLEQVYQWAQDSVGCLDTEEAFRYQIAEWLKAWETLDQQYAQTRKRLEELAQAHPAFPHLLTIPGVGLITIAVYLAHLPDPTVFAYAARVVRFFGLDPVEHTSGKRTQTPRHISKRGDPIVRKALYNAALACLHYNPVLRDFYDRLRQQNKPPKVALVALSAKLLRILYAMHRDMNDWSASSV